MLASECPRHQADLREVFDRLHPVVGREQIGADGERAVVGEQQPVVRLQILAACLRQFVGRRRRVLGNRDAAERGQHFGEYGARQGDPGHGKPGRDGGMRVHHGVHVGPNTIHL